MESLWGEDNKLIVSALQGDFKRTRTREPWRGKGLPKINSHFQNKIIDNLFIVSRQGYINYETSDIRDLNGVFQGTLLSWDFTLGNVLK